MLHVVPTRNLKGETGSFFDQEGVDVATILTVMFVWWVIVPPDAARFEQISNLCLMFTPW